MLSTASVHRLVRNCKAERALLGNLLPTNNNECAFLATDDVSTVTVVEETDKGVVPVGFGLFNQCTPTQLYCSVVTTSAKYNKGYVNIEKVKAKGAELGVPEHNAKRHTLFKVENVRDELPDLSSLPQYYSAFHEPIARPLHQCVVEQLVTQTVGHANVDMRCNVTVDLYDQSSDLPEAHSDQMWRDFDGFVVGDRYRYSEVLTDRAKLIFALENDAPASTDVELRFERISKASAVLFSDYDGGISTMSREEYLEYLFTLPGIAGTVAVDEQMQPVGYVLSLNDRILQCYGESEEVVGPLLLEHVRGMSTDAVSFFMKRDEDVKLSELLHGVATKTRRVRRFHSKTVPLNVKWAKIYLLNMGVNLF